MLLAAFQTLSDDGGRILLLPLSLLRRFLVSTGSCSEPTDLLPTLIVEDAAGRAPPAWACPEASADLPPGLLLPIAGTRIGPTGSLLVPISDGPRRVRLMATTASALEINPRFNGSSSGPPNWWIAPGLGAWAHLPPGRLLHPARVAAFGQLMRSVAGAVVRWHEPLAWISRTLRRRLPPHRSSLAQRIADGPWSVNPPRLLVVLGADLKPGDPWLEIPWDLNPGANADTDSPYTKLARAILAEGSIPFPEPASRIEHVPPAQSGRVKEARLTRIRKPGSTTGSWFAFVRLERAPEATGTLTLTDGGTVLIAGDLEDMDAPYTADGDPIELLVSRPEPLRSDELDFFDGQTGELIQAYPLKGEIVWAPPSLADTDATPDQHLRRRLRDGEGIPAGPQAAALSTADRLWWSIREPSDCAAAMKIERESSASVPPWWPRMIEVLTAAALEIPPFGPQSWACRKSERRRVLLTEMPNPTVRWSRLHSNYDAEEPHRPLIEWVDDLGHPASVARAAEPAGETFVRQELVPLADIPILCFPLATPVLHPWRMPAVAGLLGIALDELDQLLTRFGPVELRPEITAALADPERSATRRLAIETDAARRSRVEACIAALREELSAPDLGGRIWIDALPVPPPPLRPNGLPLGTVDLLGSALSRAYRRVAIANERLVALKVSGSLELMRSAQAVLQHAVAQVFGDPDALPGDEEVATLAAWVRRLWPLSRSPEHLSVIPGLRRIAGLACRAPPCAPMLPDALSDPALPPMPIAAVDGSPVAPPETAFAALIDGSTIVRCPKPSVPPRQQSDPRWWKERHARHRLLGVHLPALITILAALDRPEPAWPRDCLPPDAVELVSKPHAGRSLLQVLARAIEQPETAPSRFCSLLEAPLPRRLANDPERARASLAATIDPALPGTERAVVLLRGVLIRVFGGFWQIEDRAGASRWIWLSLESPRPNGGQRAAPPLHSAAWRLWPGFDAWANPIRYLLSPSALSTPLAPAIAAAVGFEAPSPEPVVWLLSPSLAPAEPTTAGLEAGYGQEPLTEASPPPDNVDDGVLHAPIVREIDLLLGTLRGWLDSAPVKPS
jgi:hypothetical protein